MRNGKWEVAAESEHAAVSLSDAMGLKETSEGADLMDGIGNSSGAEVEEEKKTKSHETNGSQGAGGTATAAPARLDVSM